MKKIKIILIILLMLVLSSCELVELESQQIVKAPANNKPPLSGKWEVVKVIEGPHKRQPMEDSQDVSNLEGLFSKEAVIVGEDYVLDPSYKTRDIDINEYLFYNYKIDTDYLDISDEDIHILTITGEDGYFHEFIKYDEDKLIFFHNEKFIFLERRLEEVTGEEVKRYIDIEKRLNISNNIESSYTLNTGLLLGIKTKILDEETELDKWEYKTIWIRSSNREIGSIYETDGILLPRKKGFWDIDIERRIDGNSINDTITSKVRDIVVEEEGEKRTSSRSLMASNKEEREYQSFLKHILYIGNDYISLEEINPTTNVKSLRVYPIDYMEEQNPTMISSLIDVEDFYLSGKTELNAAREKLDERSFGIERKNGHWMLKGRLNYIEDKDQLYKDFKIKSIPPREIVQYDELILPWTLIKSNFPDAVNAFTSPNEDIIIIVRDKSIDIYPIRDSDIVNEKLASIKIENNQKIIMAEWGLGKYTSTWEDEVLKSDAIKIEY